MEAIFLKSMTKDELLRLQNQIYEDLKDENVKKYGWTYIDRSIQQLIWEQAEKELIRRKERGKM